YEFQKSLNEARTNDLEEQMQTLREQWKEQNAQEFDHESSCSCPTCGQDLPEEQLEEAKANFNRTKSKLLETINEKGVELKSKVESIKKENESIKIESDKLTEQGKKKSSDIERLE